MSELAQNKDVQAKQSSTPEQTTENVEIVPISQVLRLTAPDGKGDEVICYGDVEDLGKGVTASKATIIPMEIAGLMDVDEPKARQSSTKRAIAATIAAILGGGAVASAVSGCTSNSEGDTAIDQMTKKMTSDDYNHNFQDEGVACFSQPGDGPLSIGELPNGEKIIVFTRDSGGGIDHCYGVTAPDYQAAVNTECVAQDIPIEGVAFPGGNPTIPSCTADGVRIAAVRGAEVVLGDLVVNGGVIDFQNEYFYGSVQGSGRVNFIRDGGQQYLLTNNGLGAKVAKHNLDTQTQDPTTVPYECGLPSKDDAADVWTRSRLSGGDCMVVQSPTLAGLASSITQIQGISGDYQDPRAGDTMFFFNAADGNHYAIVLPYCGDTVCNNGETQANCATDCGTAPACGDGNLDAGEACDNGAANSDTAADACRTTCELPSCGDDVTDTSEECDDGNTLDGDGCSAVCETEIEPVCGDGTCETPETNATCPTDCPPGPVCGDNVCETPETNATCATDCALDPSCQPFMDDSRIRFVQGAENCELTDCVDTPLEELLTVQGECTFELDFGNANPAEVTIAGANGSADGAYRIDFIEEMGEMLRGQYYVDDNGNSLGTTYTKNGNTVATVVEGTKYGGEEMTIPETSHDGYRLECGEGRITVYKNGELVTTLNANDSTIVDMEENETDPDAGVDGGVDSGTDGGADAGVDAGTTPPSKPGCGEGCSTSGDKLPAGELAFIGLMLLALGRKMRRAREESIMENRPTAPGGVLLNHVKRSVGKYFEGLRK